MSVFKWEMCVKSILWEFRKEETKEIASLSGHGKVFIEGGGIASAVWVIGERTIGCRVGGQGWEVEPALWAS